MEDFKKMLKDMSFSDLHTIYVFVSGDFNKQFGVRTDTREIVHSRYKLILEELNKRAYGCDPYMLEIKGDKPEDIDLSKYDEEDKPEKENPKE